MKLSVMYEAIDMNKAVAEVMAFITRKRFKPGYAIQMVANKYGINRSELARAMSAHAKAKTTSTPAEPEPPKMVQGSLF